MPPACPGCERSWTHRMDRRPNHWEAAKTDGSSHERAPTHVHRTGSVRTDGTRDAESIDRAPVTSQPRMRIPPTLPVVLAGFAAFLDLYATQPFLPLLVCTFDASTFEVGLTDDLADDGGRACPPRGRPPGGPRSACAASSSPPFLLGLATALAATSVTLRAADRLAPDPGRGHPRHLRRCRRLCPRDVARDRTPVGAPPPI